MAEEAPTTPVEEDGAPVTETAAPSEAEAPAGPPEGFIEQDRYENLRKEFNQRNALIDRAKSGDNDALRELIGAEFAADEEEDPDLEDEDQEEFRDPRVDSLIQERQQERETAILGEVSDHIGKLLTEAKVEVPERFKQAILSEAWLRGGGASISPEVTESVVKEWVDEYKQLERTAGDRYIQSKRAPHVSRGGTGATDEVLPLDATHAQRVEFMAQRTGLGLDE